MTENGENTIRKYDVADENDATDNGGYGVVVERFGDLMSASVEVTRDDNGKAIKLTMSWDDIAKVPFDEELIEFGVSEYRRVVLGAGGDAKNATGSVRRFRMLGTDAVIYRGRRADGDGEPEFIFGWLRFKKTAGGWRKTRAARFSFGFGGRYSARFLMFGKIDSILD